MSHGPRPQCVLQVYHEDEYGDRYILMQSIVHNQCPPVQGMVRGHMRTSGFLIHPIRLGTDGRCLAIYLAQVRPCRGAGIREGPASSSGGQARIAAAPRGAQARAGIPQIDWKIGCIEGRRIGARAKTESVLTRLQQFL